MGLFRKDKNPSYNRRNTVFVENTVRNLKIGLSSSNYSIISKCPKKRMVQFYSAVICPTGANGMAKCVDPDHDCLRSSLGPVVQRIVSLTSS